MSKRDSKCFKLDSSERVKTIRRFINPFNTLSCIYKKYRRHSEPRQRNGEEKSLISKELV